ncbi:MAG: hypothetical protein V3U48_00970, partial [Rhodospirillales bacterium]
SEADEWSTAKISDWWDAVKDGKDAPAKAALLYSLFDALGDPVPAQSWEDLVTGTGHRSVTFPNPALWFRLLDATEAAQAGGQGTEEKTATLGDTVIVSDVTSEGAGDGSGSPGYQASNGGRKRVAETVLLSLIAMGEAGPAGADPLLLRQVIISLRAAGFGKEARAMAVEAALAAGL